MMIADLTRSLQDFAVERDWEQFHTPKNLVMALAGEVGELTELFQWLTPEESAEIMTTDRRAAQVRDEIPARWGWVSTGRRGSYRCFRGGSRKTY
jgi:dCTP diphosphatase